MGCPGGRGGGQWTPRQLCAAVQFAHSHVQGCETRPERPHVRPQLLQAICARCHAAPDSLGHGRRRNAYTDRERHHQHHAVATPGVLACHSPLPAAPLPSPPLARHPRRRPAAPPLRCAPAPPTARPQPPPPAPACRPTPRPPTDAGPARPLVRRPAPRARQPPAPRQHHRPRERGAPHPRPCWQMLVKRHVAPRCRILCDNTNTNTTAGPHLGGEACVCCLRAQRRQVTALLLVLLLQSRHLHPQRLDGPCLSCALRFRLLRAPPMRTAHGATRSPTTASGAHRREAQATAQRGTSARTYRRPCLQLSPQ